MGIKLVALDMDGTTLASDITLADPTKAAIMDTVDKGIYVVPCTGRVMAEVPSEVLNIPGIHHAITSNGAKVTDLKEKKAVYSNCIQPEDLVKIIDVLDQYDLMIEAYVDGQIVTEARCMNSLGDYNVLPAYWNMFYATRTTEKTRDRFIDRVLSSQVEKFNIFFKHLSEQKRLQSQLIEETGMKVLLSAEKNLEINNPTANKGDSLAHLCQCLGIDLEDVMAVGDSNNDYEMMKKAGTSIAMENAIDRVKSVSDYVTKSNDDYGVAHALHKFILN